MRAIAVPLILLSVSAAVGVAGWLMLPRYLPPTGAVVGLKIDGIELKPGEPIEQHIQRRADALAQRRVRLRIANATHEATLAELGVQLETIDATRRASSIGRRGGWGVRLAELRDARRRLLDVPLSVRVDHDVLAARLAALKERTDTPATPARFNMATREIIAHRDGEYLDVAALAQQLRGFAFGSGAELEATRMAIAPKVNSAMLRSLKVDTVISEFETRFSRGGDANNRARNIEVAASKLDGLVLAPGELVSFNGIVGARTLANGFKPGWEIYRGEMVRGVGGGTCQVSSTFHAAALYAGLDIMERYPHSRPSAYIPVGLDSTVSWPSVDLKLRNRWQHPVVVHANVQGNKITVQLLGARKFAKVTFRRETLKTYRFKRKITETHWLKPGTVIRKQKGIRGYLIRRTRKIITDEGQQRVEVTVDAYPPTPEHYLVAPGTDLEVDLPAPPEGSVDHNPDAEPASEDQTASAAAVIESRAPIDSTNPGP